MVLFESTLTLVLVAIVLLQVSRRLAIPYPTMLAGAGVVVAALPWAPDFAIDPHLALALFIAPALLDAAYDLPPRAIRSNWLPLLALAAIAVVLTTAVVAWAGVVYAGLPLSAAIALGAIVAPPDAAAAAAVLARFVLPRRTVTILKGESLLNDAVALLIFSAAVGAASDKTTLMTMAPQLALAIPGGLLLGAVLGKSHVIVSRFVAGTLGGTILGFVMTFGVWVIADRLHLSAVLAVVAFAMTIARYIPERQSALDRVHSYSVWEAAVFLLNVLAFLLVGLQARAIVGRLDPAQFWHALGFAGIVTALVVAVRLVWVFLYNRVLNLIVRLRGGRGQAPTFAQGLVVAWCGMRGLVTLATALALPAAFPSRDVIVLSALAVVLGTLVLQGLTLGPLIHFLRFAPDTAFDKAVSDTRVTLLDAAAATLDTQDGEAATLLREEYRTEREVAADGKHPRAVLEVHQLRQQAIIAKRQKLATLRCSGAIDDDIFHMLERELDWAELASSPPDRFEIVES
ncbi:sodium:proton antiporter [Beijerinckia sp. L45]|uniref:cation:proton antiporter n=1 Tax=Beijerinckia sp. L45 TaxID=1641855 RepID=UPI00131DF8D3|nr:cation:proton antiporter [Beijerinckia sp. L45]